MTIEELLTFINTHCKGKTGVIKRNTADSQWWTKNQFSPYLDEINKILWFLDTDATFTQKTYHLQNSIFEPVKCKCGKLVNWHSNVSRYSTFCGNSCSSKNTLDKRKATCKEKYGVENPFQSETIKEKIKKDLMEKYNVDNYSKTTEFSDKMVNYWKDIPSETKANIQQRREDTNEIKYGHRTPLNSPEIQQKIKNKLQERYGVDSPLQSDELLAKQRATMVDRYGKVNYQQLHISDDYIKKLKNRDWVEEQLKTLSPRQLSNMIGLSYSHVCKLISDFGLTNTQISSFHREISLLISELGFVTEENTKNILSSRKELDIYIREKNLAIECNGVYWHSEISGRKHPKYHLDKTVEASTLGLSLLHVTDSEWYDPVKSQIIRSKITHLCGKTPEVIYARKCKIVKVSSSISRDFLNANHIQGFAPSSVCYGLEYEGELKMVMSFGKPRFSKKYQWELIRSSAKNFVTVVGGFSKLLAQFVREHNPESLVSYCNRNWSLGNVYEKNNFELIGESAPSYQYHKHDGNFFNRLYFQKHKLNSRLEKFDPLKTEWENMRENGYDRIWDTGNLVYSWIVKVDNKSNP